MFATKLFYLSMWSLAGCLQPYKILHYPTFSNFSYIILHYPTFFCIFTIVSYNILQFEFHNPKTIFVSKSLIISLSIKILSAILAIWEHQNSKFSPTIVEDHETLQAILGFLPLLHISVLLSVQALRISSLQSLGRSSVEVLAIWG